MDKYVSNGSMCNVFAKTFAIKKHPLLGDWKELEGVENNKKRPRKEVNNVDESDDADTKYGARLLLLLTYMMVSNVLDDNSNITQM